MRNTLALCLAFLLASCASYTRKTEEGYQAFSHRDFAKAGEVYKQGAEEEGVDQLVYLFDRATVRHTAADYENSIRDFLLADKLSEIKDYTALATEIATIVTNDRITHYKGEEFEHVLVSAYLAMNYLALGKDEDAIVECRRVNRKLERLRSEGKRKYDLNAFAQYLSGVLYEKEGNWNSANIDYKKTYEILPEYGRLARDLVRGAEAIDSSRDLEKWKKTFSLKDEDIKDIRKEMKETGSVVLIYQNGFAPEKVVSEAWPELPAYKKRYNKHRAAHLYLDGNKVARSELLFDVEKAAFDNMDQKYALYILKRAAGFVAREVIGNQVAKQTNNELLGAMVKVAMFASSQPDLRSWLTLPQNFQVARAAVKPGKYRATVRLENAQGQEEEPKDLGEVEVKKKGAVAILNYRSLND